jgi:hypothetical protein
MKDESGQAFPVAGMSSLGFAVVNEIGLTKRELFAAMAMQGMLSHGWCNGNDPYTVKAAIDIADLLLAALEGRGE